MKKIRFIAFGTIFLIIILMATWLFVYKTTAPPGADFEQTAIKFTEMLWKGDPGSAYKLLSRRQKASLTPEDFETSITPLPNRKKYLGLLRQIVFSSGFVLKNPRAKTAYVDVFINNIHFESRVEKMDGDRAVVQILMRENNVTRLSEKKSETLKMKFSEMDVLAKDNENGEQIISRMKNIFQGMPVTKSRFIVLEMVLEKGRWAVDTKFENSQ